MQFENEKIQPAKQITIFLYLPPSTLSNNFPCHISEFLNQLPYLKVTFVPFSRAKITMSRGKVEIYQTRGYACYACL